MTAGPSSAGGMPAPRVPAGRLPVSRVLDVAIVGGGLCGLALAHSLQARGIEWRLFESRERLGGRLHTVRGRDGTPVDLGATWYWPATQPGIARLVDDLGLASFAQHDDGRVLHLADVSEGPRTVAMTAQQQPAHDDATPATPGAVHGGARRIAGGVQSLVQALARQLPPARLRCGQRLETLVDHGDAVELRLVEATPEGERRSSVVARRVVLALPPRLAAERLRFEPALPAPLQASLEATPTWMATAAKAGFVYPSAFWREEGHSGNAWVSHAQAMLAEVFDACGPDASREAALAGFAALGAAQRGAFERGRTMLLESQMTQLFGAKALDAEILWRDWAEDAATCSPRDIAEEAAGGAHPAYGDATLQAPQWGGRLHFGGSETARHGGGYMEGALSAAARLRKLLTAQAPGRAGTARREPANGQGARPAANDTPARG